MECKWSNDLDKVILLLSEFRCEFRIFWVRSFIILLYCRWIEVWGLWLWGCKIFVGWDLEEFGIIGFNREREGEES